MPGNTLTSEERLRAAFHGREVDYVPFSPFLAYVWEHFPAAVQQGGQPAFLAAIGADPLWRGAACPVRLVHDPRVVHDRREAAGSYDFSVATPAGSLHGRYLHSDDGHTDFLVEHPVKTRDDFRVLRWIEEHAAFEPQPERAHAFRAEHSEGLPLGMLLPRGKSAWQSLVEHWVGTEELIYALCDFPGEVEATWRVMADNDRRAAAMAAATGTYDHWITWEDSSTQNYSPDQYRRHIGDEIAAWCAILKDAGQHYVQHACGHVADLVGMMRAGGVLAVESLSPPPTGNLPLAEARARVGEGLGIIGGIEPTRFLHLPDADLPAYVEEVLADGAGGPFVLANADSCPPGVTPERFAQVAAVTAACSSGT